MPMKVSPGVTFSFVLILTVIGMKPAFAAPTDACALLTLAQVTAAVGVPVSAGTHVNQTFTKTCTWTPSSPGEVKAVTLNLQTAPEYDGGKTKLEKLKPLMPNPPKTAPVTGLGDDAYVLEFPNITSLFVKKGSGAFKLVVYGAMPPAKAETAVKTLASDVLPQL
jgi:hypothetical protein